VASTTCAWDSSRLKYRWNWDYTCPCQHRRLASTKLPDRLLFMIPPSTPLQGDRKVDMTGGTKCLRHAACASSASVDPASSQCSAGLSSRSASSSSYSLVAKLCYIHTGLEHCFSYLCYRPMRCFTRDICIRSSHTTLTLAGPQFTSPGGAGPQF